MKNTEKHENLKSKKRKVAQEKYSNMVSTAEHEQLKSQKKRGNEKLPESEKTEKN